MKNKYTVTYELEPGVLPVTETIVADAAMAGGQNGVLILFNNADDPVEAPTMVRMFAQRSWLVVTNGGPYLEAVQDEVAK